MPGGIGAYTDSRGAPGIRQEIADYLTERDGFPSDPEVCTALLGSKNRVLPSSGRFNVLWQSLPVIVS